MSTKMALRRFIQKKNIETSHSLKNCHLVIDGDSFFKESYKNSGCQFLLGPDCNVYASYLLKQLKCFSKCGVTCYVIFKGTTTTPKEYIQKIVDELNDPVNRSYFEPLLVKDVQKQLLERMGMKYFCCEYESIDAIIGVARTFKCPVLTDNLEYCFYGVSCIPPNSVSWQEDDESVKCIMYKHDVCKSAIGVHNKMPIFLTIFSMISELPQYGNVDDVSSVIRWVKHQQKDVIVDVATEIDDVDKRKTFLELYERSKVLYLYPSSHLAVKYFQRQEKGRPFGLYKDDKKWVSKGVSNGRIAIPYVAMKRKGLVIGSTVVNDTREQDAIQAASQIITYAHCLLTNSQKSNLTYIGRKGTNCTTWKSDNCWKQQICNRDIFNKYGKMKKKPSLGNPFKLFIEEVLSKGIASDIYLSSVPPDCFILVVTLVYYVHKVNVKFVDCAYCVLLCYVLLNPVSKKISEGTDSKDEKYSYKDCQFMYDKLNFLFNYNDAPKFKYEYESDILHSLAEFLHCLQHMNYLYKLCGQSYTEYIPSTVYYQTYNATFVYNAFKFMKSKNNLMKYLEINVGKDSWPLKLYKSIVSTFENYLECLKNGTDDGLTNFNKMFSLSTITRR